MIKKKVLLILYFSFWALRVFLAVFVVEAANVWTSAQNIISEGMMHVLSPCSQESKVDIVENCLVIETEIAIRRGMAKLCKLRPHE